jgi:hypothetical protein
VRASRSGDHLRRTCMSAGPDQGVIA